MSDLLVSELESIKSLLDENSPKVLNARHRLGELIEKEQVERPKLEKIRALLRSRPPKAQGASYELHLLIKRLVNNVKI